MEWVLITAGIIALSTVIGTFIGFCFKNISKKANNCVIGFSAGVMLCAAVGGLIEPAIEYGGNFGVLIAVLGIFCGALFLWLVDKLMPKINSVIGVKEENGQGRVMLLVAAIAIHHLPEGIAAGVSFGTGNMREIAMVCGGIAIQNMPEAAVIIAPMLNSGVSRKKAVFIALISGGMEVIGTLLGFFFVTVANAIMPFALAFAGGSMMYIIIDEMIPQTHGEKFGATASFFTLFGFSLMLIFDTVIGMI
ncbi:MAG: ZIP family metal transporter [Ruminococcaceae bacterium]|nr:ZIP family metal transporter [Oscillospiraceae bacterium]